MGCNRSNRLPTSKRLLYVPPLVALELINLDGQFSAWLSNKMPLHGFQKKLCIAFKKLRSDKLNLQTFVVLTILEN